MFDLSALTGMNKSQYVILKMQLGERMQVIWKTERGTSLSIFSLCVCQNSEDSQYCFQ